MRRALLGALCALAACTPTHLESGRYACERDQPDQCPGQWRCGLEGYCHQLGNTSVAWRCESDDDCEGGFRCGLSKTQEYRECHDPAAPQDWPCEVQGDCLGGWTCGLTTGRDARQCHDPAAPRSWPCETSADCVGGWSCGLASDGELRECHDPQNPRAWACVDDEDCLGGWRCGTERVCVDPSADALGQLTLAPLDGGAHLSPRGSTSPVTLLSVSPFYSEGRGRGRGNLAFVQDGRVHAMSLDSITGGFSRFDLGTEQPHTLLAHGARGANSFGGNDELDRVSIVWPDGGTSTFTFDGGAFDRYDIGDQIMPIDTLHHGSAGGGFTPSVFGFSSTPGDYYLRLRGDDGFTYDLLPEFDWTDFQQVPNNRIHSMTGLRRGLNLECVYVTDERGLWVQQRGGSLNGEDISSYLFEPVNIDLFQHTECVSAGPKIRTVRGVGDRWLAVTAEPASGPVQVAVLDADRTWSDRDSSDGEVFCSSFAYRPCAQDDRIRVDLAYGPCTACPTGSTFMGMSTVIDAAGGPPMLEVVCGQPNAGGVVFRISASASGTSECVRTLVTGGSSYFSEPTPRPALPAPGVVAWSGSQGQVWFGADSTNIASLSFDRAATGMVRRGPGPDDFTAFTPQLLGTPSPVIGLVSTRSVQLSAPVLHAPSFAMSQGQLLDLTGTTAVSSARTVGYVTALTLGSPISAAITRSSAGKHLAVVSAGTSLYAGDVDQVLTSAGPAAALSQRLSTVEPIASLSFPKEHAQGPGPLLTGYAIVGSSVARVVADTLTRWRSEPVPLPLALQPRATWFQGTKGRVGFHDGSVFSLPSRVRIAEAIAGGEVVDYAQPCGQQLALTPTGLYRLEPGASGPIGRWVELPLPGEVESLDFTDGRVHGLGADVFVFTRIGVAARITFESCPE